MKSSMQECLVMVSLESYGRQVLLRLNLKPCPWHCCFLCRSSGSGWQHLDLHQLPILLQPSLLSSLGAYWCLSRLLVCPKCWRRPSCQFRLASLLLLRVPAQCPCLRPPASWPRRCPSNLQGSMSWANDLCAALDCVTLPIHFRTVAKPPAPAPFGCALPASAGTWRSLLI